MTKPLKRALRMARSGVLMSIFATLPAQAETLADIKAAGEINVCTAIMGLKPYLYREGNSYGGFEYDILNEMLERMSIPKLNYVTVDWAAQIAALKSGRCDMIFSAVVMSEQRRIEGGISFSRPYFYVQDYVVVQENGQIKSLDDLKGKSIGAIVGSAQEIQAKSLIKKGYGETFKGFNDVKSPMLALLSGQVDAVIADSFAYKTQKQMTPDIIALDVRLERVAAGKWEEPQKEAPYRFGAVSVGVRVEDGALTAEINKALDAMDADGTRQKILSKYDAWNPEQELANIMKK